MRAGLRRVALCAAICCADGCGSIRYPPELSAGEAQELGRIRERVSTHELRVCGSSAEVLSRRLSRAGLRAELLTATSQDAADIEVVGTRYTSPSIPHLTLLTLGLIPTIGTDQRGYDLRVTRADGVVVPLSCTWDEDYVFGWLGVPLALLPRWSIGVPREPEQVDARVALCIGSAWVDEPATRRDRLR